MRKTQEKVQKMSRKLKHRRPERMEIWRKRRMHTHRARGMAGEYKVIRNNGK